jgi:glycosyltransferase involved in cell wall biosynthesis
MVVDGSYPNDIRVRKEAEALAENGKKVLVVCPKYTSQLTQEEINGVQVYRIGKNYTTFKKGIHDIFESVFNINLFFYFNLKKVFKKYTIGFLHVHDLPLAGTCYLFKHEVKGLILDLHENYPEALKTWFLWKKSPVLRIKNSIFMNPKNWSKKEEKYCKKYNTIICVVEEMKKKLHTNFQINPSKMHVISNHEKKSFQANFEANNKQHIIDSDVFSITYVGGFGPHRGLDTAIAGMKTIVQKIPTAKLFLVGKGNKDVEAKLKSITSENNVENSVEFVGYRPFEEVAAIMSQSTINIIPHHANEHTDNTIPHKLFQIMMSKSLLLVSSCKPLKRIVEKYDAGLVFEASNVQDFSTKVIEAYSNTESLSYKTENAYNAVMQQGENWETESEKLIQLYDNLAN